MAFRIVNLLDLLQKASLDDVHDFLCTFSCPLNAEIEDFIKNKSIDFSRQKISITHLVLNEQYELAAFFSSRDCPDHSILNPTPASSLTISSIAAIA